MNIYEAYKPLRNLLREFNLQASIEDSWFYSQMLDGRLPPIKVQSMQGRVSIRTLVHPWDMATLAREIVLNATTTGKRRLLNWPDMSALVRAYRRLQDAIAADTNPESAFASLHPVAHHQFPWQGQREFANLIRYFKIFSAPEVDAILVSRTGVSARNWLFMGMAVAGNMLKEKGINATQSYEAVGVDLTSSQAFFERMSIPIAELRERTAAQSHYDERWEYTWNPLTATPLVALNPAEPFMRHCPMPPYLLKRVSQGLYYDIYDADGFENAFGPAFEVYTGELLAITFPPSTFHITTQAPYKVRRQLKNGIDWIVSDSTGNVFIECKAKRMRQDAKETVEPEVIAEQIAYLARAVVQIYKNLVDALGGATGWTPNGLPTYPLVLTLEDWYLLGNSATTLKNSVVALMNERRLDLTWLDTMPYTVACCADFEAVSPTIASIGIERFFSARTRGDMKTWTLKVFTSQAFPEVYRDTYHRTLFPDDWARVMPAHLLPFDTSPPDTV